MPSQHPLEAKSEAVSEATADLSSITDSRAQGPQHWSQDQAKYELRATSEAHRHAIELEKHKHNLTETTKDNAQRRLAFNIVLGVLVVVLFISLFLTIMSENSTTRVWAQGAVSSILGGIVGGVAGYFTGKNDK